MSLSLNSEQKEALKILDGKENIFLTGAAGTGKSFLIRHYLKSLQTQQDDFQKTCPILASTGAAAILVGGRTFHSFFGVGILEGGAHKTVERALENKKLKKRLQKTKSVIIDEISMLSGTHLWVAERICRKARENSEPWGGIRIIGVGDFAQLPPVNPHGTEKDWAFLDPVWEKTHFRPLILKIFMRSQHREFLEVLHRIRKGQLSPSVIDFLHSRKIPLPRNFSGTRLFARRDAVENYNLQQLQELPSPSHTFPTLYIGKENEVEKFKRQAPIPESLTLKEGALIMLRQNDVEGRWVNGSLGYIQAISEDELLIELLSGREITVEKSDFTLLNADGTPVVIANNFPLTLAWAVTIHKAQGATLDQMQADLRGLWEPGQAYVALSRVASPEGLYLEGWHPRSFLADPRVSKFHSELDELASVCPLSIPTNL